MINICPNCGNTDDKELTKDNTQLICLACGHHWNFKRLPLFIMTGASGVGKTSTMQELIQNEQSKYCCTEQDLFSFMPGWNEEELKFKREKIMQVARNITQAGLPVVIGSASIPEQFENCYSRRFFSEVYHFAITCKPEVLEQHMREGRKIDNEEWIQGSIGHNNWLIEHGPTNDPPIKVFDITEKTTKQAAQEVDVWIMSKLKKH